MNGIHKSGYNDCLFLTSNFNIVPSCLFCPPSPPTTMFSALLSICPSLQSADRWRQTLKFVGRGRTARHEYQWHRVSAGNWMSESEGGVSTFPPMHFHSAGLSLII